MIQPRAFGVGALTPRPYTTIPGSYMFYTKAVTHLISPLLSFSAQMSHPQRGLPYETILKALAAPWSELTPNLPATLLTGARWPPAPTHEGPQPLSPGAASFAPFICICLKPKGTKGPIQALAWVQQEVFPRMPPVGWGPVNKGAERAHLAH